MDTLSAQGTRELPVAGGLNSFGSVYFHHSGQVNGSSPPCVPARFGVIMF